MTPVTQNPPATSPLDQLLAQLQGPALPGPVSAWPPAPGWWLLGFLLAGIIALAVFWMAKRKANNRYRKVALATLNRLVELETNEEKIYRIKALIKQTFFTAYPAHRNRVAALHGKVWLQELRGSANLGKLPEQQLALFDRFFCDEIYQPASDLYQAEAFNALAETTRFWITHHTTQLKTTQPAPTRPPTTRGLY